MLRFAVSPDRTPARVQGLPAALKDSCKRTLEAQGVRMRSGRVTKVVSGRESTNGDIGKKIAVELSEGGTVEEHSDLVCWTAGVRRTVPCPVQSANPAHVA